MHFGLGGAPTVNKPDSFEEQDEEAGKRKKENSPGLKSRLKESPFPCQKPFISTIYLVNSKWTNLLRCQSNFRFENEWHTSFNQISVRDTSGCWSPRKVYKLVTQIEPLVKDLKLLFSFSLCYLKLIAVVKIYEQINLTKESRFLAHEISPCSVDSIAFRSVQSKEGWKKQTAYCVAAKIQTKRERARDKIKPSRHTSRDLLPPTRPHLPLSNSSP